MSRTSLWTVLVDHPAWVAFGIRKTPEPEIAPFVERWPVRDGSSRLFQVSKEFVNVINLKLKDDRIAPAVNRHDPHLLGIGYCNFDPRRRLETAVMEALLEELDKCEPKVIPVPGDQHREVGSEYHGLARTNLYHVASSWAKHITVGAQLRAARRTDRCNGVLGPIGTARKIPANAGERIAPPLLASSIELVCLGPDRKALLSHAE